MKNICFISLLFFLVSCDPDSSFEQIAVVDIPDHESLLAISSNIQAGDSVINVLVSKSQEIFTETEFERLTNASVNLYKNDVLFEMIPFDNNYQVYRKNLDSPILNDQATYRLEVGVSNEATTMATQTMPNIVAITDLSLDQNRNLGDYEADVLGLEFNDPADEDNYYMLEVFYEGSDFQGNTTRDRVYLYPLFDLSDEISNGRLLFSDATFNGNRYKIEAEAEIYNQSVVNELQVRLISITRDRYLFEKSLSQYRNADGNPFAEPVVVHDNIENGYGIFTVAAIDEMILEL